MMRTRRCTLSWWEIVWGTAALAAIVIAIVLTLACADDQINAEVKGAIVGGLLAIFLALVGGLSQIMRTRENLVNLFASEIKAIQEGLSTMEMFDFWKKIYAHPEGGAFGFANVPRQEDYFSHFDSVSDNIGNLHPDIVEAIVRFYTYLKMSRDAAASLDSWKGHSPDPSTRKRDVRYVVQLLALSMLWGFVALSCMGFRADKDDRALKEKIKVAYDAVTTDPKSESVADMKLDDFMRTHVRKDRLEAFFGSEA